MPYYYAVNVQGATSNGSANTETDMLRTLTVANQAPAQVKGLYGAMRSGTAGGAQLRARRFATASTVGAAATPDPRRPGQPAASLTAFTLPTAGATPTQVLSIGLAQTGGMGGWVALEPDHAIWLNPNGGANGNLDILSIANAASIGFDYTVEHSE